MGPQDRAETWSAPNSNQLKHSPITTRNGRTRQIYQRTHHQRHHTRLQKSLRRRLLLHQKEEWEATTSTGLLTSQRMDHQKSLPLTSNPTTDRLLARVYPLHHSRHLVGVQHCKNPPRGLLESSVHHSFGAIRTNSHVLRSYQLSGDLPDHDEHNLPRTNCTRNHDSVHG